MDVSQLKNHNSMIERAISNVGAEEFARRVAEQQERDPFEGLDVWSDDYCRRARANYDALIAREVAAAISKAAG